MTTYLDQILDDKGPGTGTTYLDDLMSEVTSQEEQDNFDASTANVFQKGLHFNQKLGDSILAGVGDVASGTANILKHAGTATKFSQLSWADQKNVMNAYLKAHPDAKGIDPKEKDRLAAEYATEKAKHPNVIQRGLDKGLRAVDEVMPEPSNQPSFESKAGQFIESGLVSGARSLPTMGLLALNAPAGIAAMYAQQYDQLYKQYKQEGKDDETADTAAHLGSALQLPFEFIGGEVALGLVKKAVGKRAVKGAVEALANPSTLKKIWKATANIMKGGTAEALEQYPQDVMQTVADEYAKDPNASSSELVKRASAIVGTKEFQIQAAKNAGQAWFAGAGLVGGAHAVGAGARGIRIAYDHRGLTNDQKAELKANPLLEAKDFRDNPQEATGTAPEQDTNTPAVSAAEQTPDNGRSRMTGLDIVEDASQVSAGVSTEEVAKVQEIKKAEAVKQKQATQQQAEARQQRTAQMQAEVEKTQAALQAQKQRALEAKTQQQRENVRQFVMHTTERSGLNRIVQDNLITWEKSEDPVVRKASKTLAQAQKALAVGEDSIKGIASIQNDLRTLTPHLDPQMQHLTTRMDEELQADKVKLIQQESAGQTIERAKQAPTPTTNTGTPYIVDQNKLAEQKATRDQQTAQMQGENLKAHPTPTTYAVDPLAQTKENLAKAREQAKIDKAAKLKKQEAARAKAREIVKIKPAETGTPYMEDKQALQAKLKAKNLKKQTVYKTRVSYKLAAEGADSALKEAQAIPEEFKDLKRKAIKDVVNKSLQRAKIALGKVKIKVHYSTQDLAAAGEHALSQQITKDKAHGKVEGLIDQDTGTIHLFGESLDNIVKVKRTLWHELGHKSLKDILPAEQLTPMMNQVRKKHGDAVQAYMDAVPGVTSDEAAEEVLMHRFETKPDDTLSQRLFKAIKSFKKNADLDDAIADKEINKLVSNMRKNLRGERVKSVVVTGKKPEASVKYSRQLDQAIEKHHLEYGGQWPEGSGGLSGMHILTVTAETNPIFKDDETSINVLDKDLGKIDQIIADKIADYKRAESVATGKQEATLEDAGNPDIKYRLDFLKWFTRQDKEIFGTVNNRLGKELEIFESLFGPSSKAMEIFPGKFDPKKRNVRPLIRSIQAHDLGEEMFRVRDSGELAKLLDPKATIAGLMKTHGFADEAVHAPTFLKIIGEKGNSTRSISDGKLKRYAKKQGITDWKTLKPAKAFVEELYSLRDDQPILSNNGKAGKSVDLPLATCQPTTPCKECYAAVGMIRRGTVQKAMRNMALLITDPKGFAERIAAEIKPASKSGSQLALPFIRLLGSGDLTMTEEIESFNHLATLVDRPIQIFSRHHDNLAKLKGTADAPFIKMGSIDADLYKHYGHKFLVENMDKRGIANAFLFTDAKELPIIEKLYKDNALALVLSTSWKLHQTLPVELRQGSCPCDADERSYFASCRQCALSNLGCFMSFSDKGFTNTGKVVNILDAPPDTEIHPFTQFLKDAPDPANNKVARAYSQVAADMYTKSISLVQLYRRKFVDAQKAGKKPSPIALKDLREPKKVTHAHNLETADAYIGNLKHARKLAEQGTFSLPGGEIQPPVEYKEFKKVQYRRTATPEFKKWFGKSKVADENGVPMIMYHGTKTEREFTQFDTQNKDLGAHFTQYPALANTFTKGKVSKTGAEPQPRIMPVYLSIQNPLRLHDAGTWRRDEIVKQLIDRGMVADEAEVDAALPATDAWHTHPSIVTKGLQDLISKKGYDGIVYMNRYESSLGGSLVDHAKYVLDLNQEEAYALLEESSDRTLKKLFGDAIGDSYIAFDPTQVKSLYNQGTWDATQPNISYRHKLEDLTAEQRETLQHVGFEYQKNPNWYQSAMKKVHQFTFQKFIAKMADGQKAILDLEKGKDLSGGLSAYKSYNMITSFPEIFHAILHEGTPKYQDHWIAVTPEDAGGLASVWQRLGDNADDFFLRQLALSAQEMKNDPKNREHLFGKNKETGEYLDEQKQIDNLMAITEPAYQQNKELFETERKRLRTINKSILDFLEKANLINPEQRKTWERYDYMAFNRTDVDFDSGDIETLFPSSKGTGIGGIYHLGGSSRNIGDPFMNLVNTYSFLVHEGLKNLARVKTLTLAKEAGMLRTPNKKQKKGNLMSVRVAGKAQRYEVLDQPVYDAMIDAEVMTRGLMDEGLKAVLTWPKKMLTTTVTIAPGYRWANVTRDGLLTPAMQKGFIPVLGSIRGFWGSIRQTPEFREWASTGGAFSGAYHQRDVTQGTASATNKLKKDLKHKRQKWNPINLWDLWNKIGEAAENAARFEVYRIQKKKGASTFDAAYASKDLLNFHRSGQAGWLKFLTQTVPFMNARIQDLYKLGRVATDPKTRVNFWMYSLALAAVSSALYYHQKDDKRFKQLTDSERLMYWHLFDVPGLGTVRIAKPFEYGSIVGTIPAVVDEYLTGERSGSETASITGQILGNMFAFNPTAQLVKPIIDQARNKDSFTGIPIVPLSEQGLSPSRQWGARTSKTSRAVGKTLENLGIHNAAASPRRIDKILRDYFSYAALVGLHVTDMMLAWAGNYPEDPAVRIGDRYLTGIGRFIKGKNHVKSVTKAQQRYYKLKIAADRVYKDYHDMVKKREWSEARKYRKEHKKEYRQHQRLSRFQRQISLLNNKMKLMLQNKKMTAEEKRKERDRLLLKREALFERALRLSK